MRGSASRQAIGFVGQEEEGMADHDGHWLHSSGRVLRIGGQEGEVGADVEGLCTTPDPVDIGAAPDRQPRA